MLNAESAKFWSSDEIIGDLLYMAMMELATETFCIENRYTTPSVVDQAEYSHPARSFTIKRVEYDGVKLKPIDKRRMDAVDDNLDTTITGTPQYYTWFDGVFQLFPAPDTAGLDLKIWSYDEPSVPTDTSTLEIPTRYHPKLAIGTAYYMTLKELGHPNTGLLERRWLNSIQDVKRHERARKRGDSFQRVITEEELPTVTLGAG